MREQAANVTADGAWSHRSVAQYGAALRALPRCGGVSARCHAAIAALVLALGAQATSADEAVGWLNAYREPAQRLIAESQSSTFAWERLAFMGDTFGSRLSGSEGLANTISWALDEMKRDGLENVRAEPVKVPHWVRGQESLEIVRPHASPLVMLGLGGSVGTPPDGIEAALVVVKNFDELEALGADRVRGKIVLFNAPYTGYRETVPYRSNGASRAAALGAVAVLVRSVAPPGLRTPHTGALHYADGAPRIPAAAITTEDADRLQRMFDRSSEQQAKSGEGRRLDNHVVGSSDSGAQSPDQAARIVSAKLYDHVGQVAGAASAERSEHFDHAARIKGAPDAAPVATAEVRLRLKMEATTLPDADSANVVGEIRGREWPDEVVVVSAHLDSWDVGTGSNDDGAGCITTWEALRLMKKLGLRPRRTVRVVLFTNEENGLAGGRAYLERHRSQLANHVAMLESDDGTFKPRGFGFTGSASARATLTQIASLLSSIEADWIGPSGEGPDIGPTVEAGKIPSLSFQSSPSQSLIAVHHTPADTIDKIDPNDMAKASAAIAVMAYVVADMPERLR